MIDELRPVEPASAAPAVSRGTRFALVDAVAVAVLLALFPVVHDVRSYLRAPYFLDEAWVALSRRFPLGDLPVLTSSTPIGWSFLLRLVPGTGYLRVVPLFFHLLAIAAGYALGRQLGWRTPGLARIGGVACAAIVVLLPAQQVRHDLKQYSADAAAVLVLLLLTARLETAWSRRRLVALGVTVVVATLFSQVAAVAGMCALGGVLLVTLGRRRWRRLAEVAAATLAVGAGVGAVFLGVAYRSHSQAMVDFWAAYFPTPRQLPHYVSQHISSVLPLLGAGHRALAVPLFACGVFGIATIAWLGRPATAIAVVLLPLAAVAMGVARQYPLFEERTSHFLFVTLAATVGIGIAGAAALVGRLADLIGRRAQAAPGPDATGQLPARWRVCRRSWFVGAVSLVAIAGYAAANANWYRYDGTDRSLPYRSPIASQDTRSAVAYVKAHYSPRDVILLSASDTYGFAFYWQPPDAAHTPWGNTVGWTITYSSPTVVLAPATTRPADLAGPLHRALDLAAQRGTGARVWIIRSYLHPQQAAAWVEALRGFTVNQVLSGVEPVELVTR